VGFVRRLFPIVAILLVYSLIPGGSELTENAVHLVTHGDTAHNGADGHEDGDPSDEHGCSGPYHVCVCHHSTSFVSTEASVVTPTAPAANAGSTPATDNLVATGYVRELFRPPIA